MSFFVQFSKARAQNDKNKTGDKKGITISGLNREDAEEREAQTKQLLQCGNTGILVTAGHGVTPIKKQVHIYQVLV